MRKVVASIALVLLGLTLLSGSAAAQGPDTTTTLLPVPDQDIVPKPDTGEEPHDAGDRGGALQIAVLVLVVLAIGACVVLVVRQSRRARGRA
jgi:hypothetical protein